MYDSVCSTTIQYSHTAAAERNILVVVKDHPSSPTCRTTTVDSVAWTIIAFDLILLVTRWFRVIQDCGIVINRWYGVLVLRNAIATSFSWHFQPCQDPSSLFRPKSQNNPNHKSWRLAGRQVEPSRNMLSPTHPPTDAVRIWQSSDTDRSVFWTQNHGSTHQLERLSGPLSYLLTFVFYSILTIHTSPSFTDVSRHFPVRPIAIRRWIFHRLPKCRTLLYFSPMRTVVTSLRMLLQC